MKPKPKQFMSIELLFPQSPTWQFKKSMLGNWTPNSIADFWKHCAQSGEWASHPIFDKDVELERCQAKIIKHLSDKSSKILYIPSPRPAKEFFQ